MAKILVVDDERHIVRLVEVNLQRAGYEVVTAYDGVEALEKVVSEKPDLICLDVMMPRLDGFGVLKTLMGAQDFEGRSYAEYKDIPIVMLTAKAQDKDIFIGWASGVTAYLTKPFNPRELLTFIERILQAVDDPDDYGDGEPVWEV